MLSENLKSDWEKVINVTRERFDMDEEEADLNTVLFIIGVQELGMGYRKFKKDDKVNLFHIAICTVLEPYGYYRYEGRDKDGWPHFTSTAKLPNLKAGEQSVLMKDAIVKYYKENGWI